MKLTAEQIAVIHSTGNIKINAVAGSGKTTTMIEYARSRPGSSRILYLAFNKSVQLEAERKFKDQGLSNVTVETAHSLAYRYIVRQNGYKVRNGYKTTEIAELLQLQNNGERHVEYVIANHIKKFITYFCNSDKEKVQQLNYLDVVNDQKAKDFVRNFYGHIQEGARRLLAMMNSGEIEVIHDFYLKKFQLQNLILPYDYILFDEGQDASGAMLDVFLKQKAIKVIVGDSHQQIYGWRYAVNSLDRADFQTYNLSASFRFPQTIADLAIKILDWKNHLLEIEPASISGKGKASEGKIKATIARTNLGLLLKSINFISEYEDIKHIYFEGKFSSYTYADDGTSLYDVLNLYNGDHGRIRDKLIQSMNDLDDLEQYIEKTEDVQLALMVEIVKEYENEIPAILKKLKELQVDEENKHKAEMIFSTVHKAKGMEYDAIQLVDDFVTETKIEHLTAERKEDEEINIAKWKEEINLLYVAVTRTKGLIRIPEKLLPKKFPAWPNIVVLKEKPDNEMFTVALATQKANPSQKPIEETKKGKSYTYEEVRLKHKKAYLPWLPSEDVQLKEMYYKGIKLSSIAEHFGRNEGAILSRLKKIGCVNFEE